jgi:hypothetical protein
MRLVEQPSRAHPTRILFDGLVRDGEPPRRLDLLEPDRNRDLERRELLYSHRFGGGVSGWLGHHTLERGRDRIHGGYRIEEILAATDQKLD